MRPIRLDCACCTLEIRDRTKRTGCSVYVLNGESYEGLAAMSEAIGITRDLARSRISQGRCLRLSTRELQSRNRKQQRRTTGDTSMNELALRFRRVMEESFAGAR